MKTEVLKIGDVEITVTFKAIKNLHLSVHPPNGHVTIASPEFYDLEKIKIYTATKWAWIKKEQQKFAKQAREKERKYITQESHYLFGKRYLLKVLNAKKNAVLRKAHKLELQVIDPENIELKRKVLYRFYRAELQQRMDAFIKHYSKIMGLAIPAYTIRAMKTKWGSCAVNTNRLLFNIELAKKPLDCIEYIVVHELVHLLEKKHNKNFILLMDKCLPSWRVQKKVLNELPL